MAITGGLESAMIMGEVLEEAMAMSMMGLLATAEKRVEERQIHPGAMAVAGGLESAMTMGEALEEAMAMLMRGLLATAEKRVQERQWREQGAEKVV
jgi:predicted RNase H-like HicB family nuclease